MFVLQAGLGPMNLSALLLCVACVSCIGRYFYLRRKANPNGLPFPPGPRPLPVIGNALDIPTSYPWVTVEQLSKTYGDIIHVNMFGTHIIYLNSMEHVNELFTKRASNYSSRPKLNMIHDILDAEWAFSIMRYGLQWRKTRKIFHQYFHHGAIQQYRPSQLLEARKLLLKLLNTPEHFFQHIRASAAATIMRVTYGIEIQDDGYDPLVATVELAIQHLSAVAIPGAFLVDMFSILKYIPSWFPGGGFKKVAEVWKVDIDRARDLPYEIAKKSIMSGEYLSSVTASLLGNVKKRILPEEEYLIKSATGTAFLAGADTTISTIQSFFQAMANNPQIQKKARAELYSVIGQNRLPDFNDRDSLPYIEAIVMESFRWHPVLPLSLPHYASDNDEYNGYFIPKGAIMMGNSWAILHDEKAYPEPEEFRPERFLDANGNLDPSVQHPFKACFGFGRRMCPGRHMASNTAFISIASVLAVFDISPALDEAGKPIPVSNEVTSGALSYPVPFNCSIKPLSPEKVELAKKSLNILVENRI